jgi:glycosyltransferase involved in cell wall biosynthesis
MTERALSFCMVTTFYPPYHFGGDAMYVYRLSNELARRGHRVSVVHCADAHSLLDGRPDGAFENHPNVTVHTLASRWGAASPLVTYLSGRPGLKARALRRVLDDGFDVVHFHNISLVGGPGVLRYGSGVKLYTTHEHWLVCPMHVLWKNNREPCEQPQCLRCTLAFRRPPQLWRYTSLLQREAANVDLFLAPSRFTIQSHRDRGFTGPMLHLPSFLPTSETALVNDDAGPPERPFFLSVGRLERLKGIQTLIERFRSYDAADLLIAGEGEYGSELRRQAAGLSHVRFLGRVRPERLRSLYRRALALLVPSIGYETFGIVSLEAFAQRTPVIVRDLGGLTEAVEDSGGGFTYRTEDELTAALEAIRTDEELRRRLGERGHAGYLRLWSEEPHLRRYFSAIDKAGDRGGDPTLRSTGAA